ncbi:DUF6297 family protein, partial [Streptomyces sp. B1866]|uniref:DUF6297 family protein n=1 Tax=Streptomyces sp. B1866 TaxID=3075431 RepID=UPI00288FADDC
MTAARHGRDAEPAGFAGRLADALPAAAPALVALALWLAARAARWRGPVLADLATVSWLLPQPLARSPLLLPRLALAAVRAAALGLLTGGALGFLLSAAGLGARVPDTAAGAWCGLAAGLLGVGAGVLVERHDHARERRVA